MPNAVVPFSFLGVVPGHATYYIDAELKLYLSKMALDCPECCCGTPNFNVQLEHFLMFNLLVAVQVTTLLVLTGIPIKVYLYRAI